MKHIDAEFVPITDMDLYRLPRNADLLVGRDGAEWITGEVTLSVENVPVLVRLEARTDELAVLDDIHDMGVTHPWDYGGIRRANTGRYTGASFGTVEPLHLRRRYSVSKAFFSLEYPDFSKSLEWMVKRGWKRLKQESREFRDQVNSAPKAHKDWRIGKTPYTSGVINNTVTLPYHRDRGNVPDTGSLMWVSRKRCTGGHLHIPELNAVVDCSHGTMLAFYGEIFWHGVTVINDTSRKRSERFSIVAYSKNKILKAGSPEEEYRKGLDIAAESSEELRDTVLKYE